MKFILTGTAMLLLFQSSAAASALTSVTYNSSLWTAISNIDLDANLDQQTGQSDADLVGIAADPGFFTG